MGRRAVGIDRGDEAVRIIRRRLREIGVRPLEERVLEVAPPSVVKVRDPGRRALAG
jgi:hypothetical protein